MGPESVTDVTSREVFVVIPAWNEERRIAATVGAAARIAPVVVVDDGSRDATARRAREAGARVVTRTRRGGKGAALASGVAALPATTRYVLFLDADLEGSAADAAPLLEAVRSGSCAMAVAVPPPQPGGGHGLVVRLARDGIRKLTGFEAAAPLSGQRCLTAEAARAVRYAPRFGVEVGLTVDLIGAGYRVAEVPAELRHRVTGTDWRAQLHRARQYRDVWLALMFRSRFRSRFRRRRSR
ncbi:glycosyltransferase family 2 protein [Catenulispora subtropica]|uniref:Glucosyl-3-phosphoglycerate synthase n=1 Tax=Catenulispora subtropica TaxID=450798 RepID=A0ABP5BRC2_9ACTN